MSGYNVVVGDQMLLLSYAKVFFKVICFSYGTNSLTWETR